MVWYLLYICLLLSNFGEYPIPLYLHRLALMNFLTVARPRVSARCFLSTAVNGSSNLVSGVGSVPSPLQLRFHPLKSSGNHDKLSICNSGFCNGKLSICNSGFYNGKTIVTRFEYLLPSALAKTSLPDGPLPSNPSADKKIAVVVWSVITLLLAVGNRVLQKLALVPMKDHPFFLAQLNGFVYVAVYFSVLRARYRAGSTTDEMLSIPKLPFIVIGLLESISIVSGMYAGAMLPGPAIPLLYQTFLVWQLVFSSLLLGRRYSLNQILGCFLVGAGVVVAATSGSSNSRMLSGVGLLWPALMLASSAFQAGASIVKESIFLDAETRLKGKSLDTFVVNSFGSGFQVLFMLLFLPILSNLKGLTLSELPSYFKSGAACFLNIGTNTTGCDGAPLLPVLYIASNLLFNISILNLLKVSDAIIASLAARSAVPIAMYVLTLPLPYLPKGVSLSPLFHLGSVILVVGLILYNLPKSQKEAGV